MQKTTTSETSDEIIDIRQEEREEEDFPEAAPGDRRGNKGHNKSSPPRWSEIIRQRVCLVSEGQNQENTKYLYVSF